jgi:hypothetical protein
MSLLDTTKADFTGNDASSADLRVQEQTKQRANDQLGSDALIELFCGGIQIELFCGPPPAINLEAGEAVYACLPSTRRSEDHDVLRSLDVGTLILTSERLIFFGSVHTNEIPLADVLELAAYADALQVSYADKSKPEFYSLNLDELRIRTGRGQGLPIRHNMLMRAIEQAANSKRARIGHAAQGLCAPLAEI